MFAAAQSLMGRTLKATGKVVGVAGVLSLLQACGQNEPTPVVAPATPPAAKAAAPNTQIKASLMAYRVAEAEAGESYISRVLVTEGYLRMDQGEGHDGFVLFDRTKGIVHSVSDEEKRIIDIGPFEPVKAETAAGLEVRHAIEKDGPSIGGKAPEHYVFRASGKECLNAIVVPGLMAEAAKAYAEFQAVLAAQQLASAGNIPADMQSECDRLMNRQQPFGVWPLGLPVRVWNEAGQQELLDFNAEYVADETLFRLPEGYQRLNENADMH